MAIGKARIHILANIGGKEESHIETQADKWTSANNAKGGRAIPDFHIMAIECPDEDVVASNIAAQDHTFDNDGKITRCDVRAAALSKAGTVSRRRALGHRQLAPVPSRSIFFACRRAR